MSTRPPIGRAEVNAVRYWLHVRFPNSRVGSELYYTSTPLPVDGEQGIDVAREPLRDGGGPCDKPVIARHSIIHVRWL